MIGDGVDREIAPGEILFDGLRVLDHGMAAVRLDVLAERRHLVDTAVAATDAHRSEADADGVRGTEQLAHDVRVRGGGQIINISSIGGRTAFPFGGLYSGSKFALEAMSDVLRMELEPFNIRVSVVEPGAVDNEFLVVVRNELHDHIPPLENTPYQPAQAQFASLEQRTKDTAWTSTQVANVIIRAMQSDRPRPRYLAATAGDF